MNIYVKRMVYLILLTWFLSSYAGSYEDFFSAIRRDDPSGVRTLLQRGFDPNTANEGGVSAIHLSIQTESYKAAEILATAPGLAVDKENEHGETPLMMAALKGQKRLAVVLLDRGARVQKPGWTPLHYAACGPDAEVVSLLLGRQAALEARSPNGTTPLMMAAGYGPEAAVDALLMAKADPSAKNDLGLTAADLAQRAGRDGLAKRLAALAVAQAATR